MKWEKVNNTYEHYLAYIYATHIDKRGLLLHPEKLKNARTLCQNSLNDICSNLTKFWGFPVYVGAENKVKDQKSLNLNSHDELLKRLKELGYDVPKVRRKDEESHEYEFVDSVGALAIQKLFADHTRWPSKDAGDAIKLLMESAKIKTFIKRYINARLYKSQYFSNYNVASTITGRRGSKKNLFGFGGNGQNFPARGRWSDIWKELVIARPGKIFFFVDQVSAEDWPVQALSENYVALTEMVNGVNRHYKFASTIFGRSIDELKRGRKDRNNPIHEQCEMEYYFGKKGRHANNYGMQPTRFNESLAGEGYSILIDTCKHILNKVDEADPNVKRVYHKYIQDTAYHDKLIKCPLGRERHVLGLRSGERNYSILNELYAYIPQETVGDNTGLAIANIYDMFQDLHEEDSIVQESHDSIGQEIDDNENELIKTALITIKAFDRDITFHNGITINIPIEGKIGYDWANTIEITRDKMNEDGVREAYKELQLKYPRGNNAESAETALAG